MWPFTTKDTEQAGFSSETLRGLTVTSVRDTAGFERGVVLDQRHHQATVISRVDDASNDVTLDTWHAFENLLIDDEDVLACSTIAEYGATGNPRLVALTFAATESKEKKDHTELLTTLALHVDRTTQKAESLGIVLWPFSQEEITSYAATVWSADDTQWPPQSASGHETARFITTDNTVSVTFEINIDGEEWLEWEVYSLVDDVTEGPMIRCCRVFRPAIVPVDDVHGRRFVFITITDTSEEAVELQIRDFIAHLTPRARLRVRRFTSRQQVGLLAGAGLINAWDHISLEAA